MGRPARPAERTLHQQLVGLFAALCLLLQVTLTVHHVALAQGVEVCTEAGMVMVPLDGHPAPKQGHAHDLCCGAVMAPAPVHQVAVLSAMADAPAPLLAFARLASAWLGPLSRGPPARG